MENEAWHAVAACDAPATAAFDVAQVVGDVAATLPETAAAQESAAALEVVRAKLAGFAAVAASLSVEAAKQVEEKENSLVHLVFPDNAFAEGECKDVGQPFSLQPECYDGLDIENLSFKHTLKKRHRFPIDNMLSFSTYSFSNLLALEDYEAEATGFVRFTRVHNLRKYNFSIFFEIRSELR